MHLGEKEGFGGDLIVLVLMDVIPKNIIFNWFE